jgi:hypothetical protein
MKRFLIEREIPAIGAAEPEELRAVARRSIELIEQFRPDIEWVESYLADDKMYCVYLATDAETLRSYVGASGFPADQVNEIKSTLDPSAAA